jgi:hypothetical protein
MNSNLSSSSIVSIKSGSSKTNSGLRSGLKLLTRFPSILAAALTLATGFVQPATAQTPWVSFGANGKLAYGQTSMQDQISDFSTAGYGGGATLLPTVALAAGRHVLTPSGGDDTTQINNEIAHVAGLPLVNGFRGAVVLASGSFQISGPLNITASGIVVRGSGAGTVLLMGQTFGPLLCDASNPSVAMIDPITGKQAQVVMNPYSAFTVMGPDNQAADSNDVPDYNNYGTILTSDGPSYVPSGSRTFNVSIVGTPGFYVGQTVMVRRPATSVWEQYVGMEPLLYDWLSTYYTNAQHYLRTITAIDANGTSLTLDAPIPDSFNLNLTVGSMHGAQGGTINPYTSSSINNIGIEDLQVHGPHSPQNTTNDPCPPAAGVTVNTADYYPVESDPTYAPQYGAMLAQNVQNLWVRNVTAVNTFNSFDLQKDVNQATLTGIEVDQAQKEPGDTPQFSHFGIGTWCGRILISNSTIGGSGSINSFFVETSPLAAGPNVVLNSNFTGTGDVGGHAQWATGMLADNVRLTNMYVAPTSGDFNLNSNNHAPSFSARNAGGEGNVHGWTSAWYVVWNSSVSAPAQPGFVDPGTEFLIEAPPGATNWCIGCTGAALSTAYPATPKDPPNPACTKIPGTPTCFPLPALGTDQYHNEVAVPQSLYYAQQFENFVNFRVINVNSGLAMTAGTSGGVTQQTYTGAANQRWNLIAVPGSPGSYQLFSQSSAQAIGMPDNSSGTQAQTVACGQGTEPACSQNQNFVLQMTADGNFTIYNNHFQQVFQVASSSTSAGAAVVEEHPSAGLTSQEWTFYR